MDTATNGTSAMEESGGENMAAWICGSNDLQMKPFKLPPVLGDNQVKVRMKAVGICGSDVHYWKHLRCGDFEMKEPMVIGHECAGIIEEVGKAVKNVVVGDRVALEPGIACNKCKLCKTGFYNLCTEMEFFATPPVNGSLANHVVHPADMCFKLPENVSLEEGAACEPLSVGVHACQLSESKMRECYFDELLEEIFDSIVRDEIKLKDDDSKRERSEERSSLISVLNLGGFRGNGTADTKKESDEIIELTHLRTLSA